MCRILQISIFVFILLVIYFITKSINYEGFQTNMKMFPLFNTDIPFFSNIFTKIQASKGEKGLTILPMNAAEINQILGLPPRFVLTDKSFKQREEEQTKKENTEPIDILEYVPFIWYCQEKLFQEYRKYFTEVECLKYYYNILKTSRQIKKPNTLKWHKDNCDTTLDLNFTIKKGKKTYIGLDGIKAILKTGSISKT